MILLESRLDQVVLYPQSARLTYLLSDTLSTEQATLILPEVGGEVDWTSLQACVVEGTGRVEVIRRVPPTARAREQSELWARRRTLLEEQFRQVEALGMVLLARPQPKPSESSDKKHSFWKSCGRAGGLCSRPRSWSTGSWPSWTFSCKKARRAFRKILACPASPCTFPGVEVRCAWSSAFSA